MTPLELLTLREEWVPSRLQTRLIVDVVGTKSNRDVEGMLGQQEERVISSLRQTATKVSKFRSLGGNSATLNSLFWYDDMAEDTSWHPMRRCSTAVLSSFEFPLNPHSTGRLIWDIFGLLLVLYDIVMIPLVQMVLQHVNQFIFIMYLVANSFWTSDIVLTFLTSANQDGELTTNLCEIAQKYVKSWFLMDVLMVLPEWVCLALDSSRSGFALMRILKSFRAIRLLRMVKMESILQRQLARVNSEGLLHAVHLVQLIFAFLVLNHFTACSWYFIGHVTGSGWFEEHNITESKDIRDTYLIALHWSITQFHGSMDVMPGNSSERIFAVIVLILGMMTFSVFVSLLTNIIFQMRQAHMQKNEQQSRLRSYFSRHIVSTQVMLSVKTHLQLQKDVGNAGQDEQELLRVLPEQLGRSMLFEVRQVTVGGHWLFSWMIVSHCTAARDLFYAAFVNLPSIRGHSIFECMNACTQMYFIESGMLRYIPLKGDGRLQQERIRKASVGPNSRFTKRLSRSNVGTELSARSWVCEPALFVQAWQTRGELITISNSVLLCLEGSRFARSIGNYPALHLDVAVYARWVLRKIQDCSTQDEVDLFAPYD